MKKILTTLALLVATTILLAQAPQKFSYQGVIRDAAGNLVRNAPVGVRVSLLKNSTEGVAVYCETHRQTTNANGLLTLTIGDGTVVGGDMATIDWADGPYFLKTETDITGGSNYTLVGAQQLLSVPYALYAGSTTNGFSGDYNDLSNKPTIPEAQVNADWDAEEGVAQILNKPEIPVVPTKVSAFENDAHYLTNLELAEQLAKMQKQLDSLKAQTHGGSSWGNDSLSTAKIEQLVLPIVNTLTVDSQSRYVDAELMFHGRSHVTECGICYSKSPNPTLSDAYTPNGNKTLGSYTCRMGYLEPNTEYYVRAYATNVDGTAYGTVIKFKTSITGVDSFPCPNAPTLTDYDNNVYNTVQIGEQCWMKENLRTTHYASGGAIPMGGTSTTTGYRYYPNNDDFIVSSYGYLYNWPAAEIVCPDGWHLPSYAECKKLLDYVNSKKDYLCSEKYNGNSFAATEGWNYSSQSNGCVIGSNNSTNNATGFCLLPAGFWYQEGYKGYNSRSTFWTSTAEKYNAPSNPSSAWYYYGYKAIYLMMSSDDQDRVLSLTIYNTDYNSSTGNATGHTGRSVRCLKD